MLWQYQFSCSGCINSQGKRGLTTINKHTPRDHVRQSLSLTLCFFRARKRVCLYISTHIPPTVSCRVKNVWFFHSRHLTAGLYLATTSAVYNLGNNTARAPYFQQECQISMGRCAQVSLLRFPVVLLLVRNHIRRQYRPIAVWTRYEMDRSDQH